jgi:hypothetical protein
MLEVEVLYADRSRVSVPYTEKHTLSLAAVLGLVVRDSAVEGKKQNIAVGLGFDNYALCERIAEGRTWIGIFSWDDGDFTWRRTSNHLDNDARVSVDVPLGCMHMIFRGQQVPDSEWADALRILDEIL